MPQSRQPTQALPPAAITALTPANRPSSISSADLLGTANTLRIEHQGAIYTLRATSKGGLILTK